jgi:hypothetical protein
MRLTFVKAGPQGYGSRFLDRLRSKSLRIYSSIPSASTPRTRMLLAKDRIPDNLSSFQEDTAVAPAKRVKSTPPTSNHLSSDWSKVCEVMIVSSVCAFFRLIQLSRMPRRQVPVPRRSKILPFSPCHISLMAHSLVTHRHPPKQN